MMRRHVLAGLLASAVIAVGVACDDDDPTGPVPEVFRATLNGTNEVPTRTTPATGTAELTLVGDQLSWVITMSQITNVTASHIHIGAAGVNGGILLPLTPPVSNTRIEGSATRAQYAQNPPASPNQGVTWDVLIAMMRAGTVYVNVHTSDGDATPNEGPGDFAGGEIRGQTARISGP
ncbi:MAG TPA: CHRD domain-containing protein [Gemmatimonadaceae bacterium]|nr:CHRD domain-containing protein [Gemmatimonadaceae bacterium]